MICSDCQSCRGKSCHFQLLIEAEQYFSKIIGTIGLDCIYEQLIRGMHFEMGCAQRLDAVLILGI